MGASQMRMHRNQHRSGVLFRPKRGPYSKTASPYVLPSIYIAHPSPAIRPNTTHSSSDDPPSLLAPCTPPVISPAAHTPSMRLLSLPKTSLCELMSTPPIV